MCEGKSKSHVDAWKSVIDFTKTTISVASGILTALIGYFVIKDVDWIGDWHNYVAPFLLIVAIILSLYGFGRGIRAISSGNSDIEALRFANLGTAALVVGILSLTMIDAGSNQTIDDVLTSIERETTAFHKELKSEFCSRIDLDGDNYLITYKVDDATIEVIYSVIEQKITSVN